MLAQNKAHKVQAKKAKYKFIFHKLAWYQAGIIAISDGKGIKLDSKVIIKKIPKYHRSLTKSKINVTINSVIIKN